MNTKIKICGLMTSKDIEAVNKSMPDYIGFVFAKSKRHISDEHARQLKKMLSPEILAVGVFVNDTISHIAKLCREKTIDIIQLHGDESNEYIAALKQQTSVPIIRALRLKNKEESSQIYKSEADYFLFDSFDKNGAYGGTGKALDVTLLPELIKPTFLAGGMEEANVQEIIKKYHPYAIDVSSSVETEGKKDPVKIERMIQTVRKVGGRQYE